MKTLSRKAATALLATVLSILFASKVHAQKTLSDGIKDLATQVATNIAKEQKQKIAVLPFRELDGQPTILGTYLAEELVTNLFSIGGIEIVERSMLDKLIGELKLGQTGIIDPDTAKRVGKIAGVDAVVTGSITDLQSYVALNCRLIDAQSGKIFAAAQAKIVKDDDVRKIMEAQMPKPATQAQGQALERNKSTDTLSKTIMTKSAGEFSFELQRCTLKGNKVDCELRIINSSQDRKLDLYASYYGDRSRLIDLNGDQFFSSGVSLGGYPPDPYVASLTLVADVPMRSRLIFDGIPADTSVVKLIELRSSVGSIQFRDVPLSRP
jgi:TolB-like protein